MKLNISEAIAFVRARLDEIAQSDSDMIVNEVDDRNLNETVERLLPEAVEEVHRAAPASLLEGFIFSSSDVVFSTSTSDGVIDIDFRNYDAEAGAFSALRMVWFKCEDGILTSAEFPEDSPEGRIQLNKYVQGQPDEPVVIRQADSEIGTDNSEISLLHYKYYTTKLTQPTFQISMLPYPAMWQDYAGDNPVGEKYITVSVQLKTQILRLLTAKVLMAYGEIQRAQAFLKQA